MVLKLLKSKKGNTYNNIYGRRRQTLHLNCSIHLVKNIRCRNLKCERSELSFYSRRNTSTKLLL